MNEKVTNRFLASNLKIQTGQEDTLNSTVQ